MPLSRVTEKGASWLLTATMTATSADDGCDGRVVGGFRRADDGVESVDGLALEVQGGVRPSEPAEHRRPTRRRASSRGLREVPVDGRTQARAGPNLVPSGACCGGGALARRTASCRLRPSYGRIAGTGTARGPTLNIPRRAHRRRWPASPQAGSELPAARGRPPPPARPPRRQTGRRASPAARCLSRSGPILPKEAGPAPPRPVAAGLRAAPWHQDEGGVRGCATLE